MRIAIVNDMPMAVEGLRRLVETVGFYQVAWVAFNGQDAINYCKDDVPDLILMDIIMPVLNGVETTREIMRDSPCPILLVTSSVNKNSALVFEAMGYGALDAINTPILSGSNARELQDPLLKKISMLSILTQSKISGFQSYTRTARSKNTSALSVPLVVIGSSSGGPQALATILQSLPKDFHSPIVIVQHVDEQFASGLAQWLSSLSSIPVDIAHNGDRPTPGKVLLAGSSDHLIMTEDGTLHYSPEPREMPYRPSVDVFWKSIEQNWQGDITAVLLTGMGKDGAEAMLSLRKHGAHTIAQNEATCAVYGMPKTAIKLGAAVEVLPIEDMAGALLNSTNKVRSAGR